MSNRSSLPKIDIEYEERDSLDEKSSGCVITCHYDYGARPLVVNSSNSDTFSESCALTPKLSEMVHHEPFSVEEVQFTIFSRDQGWGGDSHVRGHYEGSWTWFDAKIIRGVDTTPINHGQIAVDVESKEQIVVVRELDGDSAAKPNAPHSLTTATVTEHQNWNASHSDIRILYHDKDIWTIHRNRRANREYFQHIVTWKRGDPALSVDIKKYIDQTGTGQNYGFVEALGPNDRIAVIARAKFPAWQNMVKFVTIQITIRHPGARAGTNDA